MPTNDHDSTHIWLRQSARFTVGDQRRTIEIAIPVQPGATAAEIERLLREADAGMGQVTAHLDAQIARITGTTGLAGATGTTGASDTTTTAGAGDAHAAVSDAPTPPPASEPHRAVPDAQRGPAAAAMAPATEAPTTEAPAPAHAARAGQPAARDGASSAGHTPARVRESDEPASQPAPSTQRAAAPATPPAAPAAHETATPSAPAGAAAGGPPLTRPEFLAEARLLGLTPPQVMERLGVRTLEGLNLREALEVLQRDVLREPGHEAATGGPGGTTARAAASATAHTTSAAPASRAPVTPAAPAVADATPRGGGAPATPGAHTASRFEEEDDDADFDVTFSLADEAEGDDAGADDLLDEDDDDDTYDDAHEQAGASLDDVPDFDAPAPAQAAPAAPAARRRATPAAAPAEAEHAPIALPLRARAATLIEQFRATTPGGAPLPNQLSAFNNIIVGELDSRRAAALVRGLWRTEPERLGTEQLHALIQWGKRDEFAEEAPAVLAALAAERTAGASATGTSNAPRATRPSSGSTTTRPAGRGGGR